MCWLWLVVTAVTDGDTEAQAPRKATWYCCVGCVPHDSRSLTDKGRGVAELPWGCAVHDLPPGCGNPPPSTPWASRARRRAGAPAPRPLPLSHRPLQSVRRRPSPRG